MANVAAAVDALGTKLRDAVVALQRSEGRAALDRRAAAEAASQRQAEFDKRLAAEVAERQLRAKQLGQAMTSHQQAEQRRASAMQEADARFAALPQATRTR